MEKLNLKSVFVGMLVLLLVQASACWAAYTIDANLADWGVTPFTDWVPNGDADYEETNDMNKYGGYWSEGYDWEALYFDDDGLNFYFAGVTSYYWGPYTRLGDLGIDLNNDSTIAGNGVVTGLEHAVKMRGTDAGDVLANPTWSNTSFGTGSPYRASGGTVLGSATIAVKHYPLMESGTYIFEASVPRNIFPALYDRGHQVTSHMATHCGNDSINLIADINDLLSTSRMDIRCDRDDPNDPNALRILADDFERMVPGLITRVIFWGSWKDDIKGQIKKIHLSFHDDIPADTSDPNSYSKPGSKLWSRDFGTGEFSETLYADQNNPEWFWDPAGGQVPVEDSDYEVWQYEIAIDTKDAFKNDGDLFNPVIYWLDVYVELEPDSNNPEFGWKTSTTQWNDDAVWSKNDGETWNELIYPSQHTYHPNSIDLAFVVKTIKPPVPHLKWSQPPIEIDPSAEVPTYCGWDEPSWRNYTGQPIWFDDWDCGTQCHGNADCLLEGDPKTGYYYVGAADLSILLTSWQTSYPDSNNYDAGADFNRDLSVNFEDLDILTEWWHVIEPPYGPGVPNDCPVGSMDDLWKVAADDFRCLGSMPVTSIHWWGSYSGGWEGQEAPAFAPIGWRIGFWSNVAEDLNEPNSFSRPEKLLWQIEVDVDEVDETLVGQDYFPQYDTCFQYYVDLGPNEVFHQGDFIDSTEDNIYWLSIAAVYPNGVAHVDYPWGWKTRPRHWMDDAVTFVMNETPQIDMTLDPCGSSMTPIKDSTFGVVESYDMTFELDTDPNYIKWEQAYGGIRYWEYYEDEKSMANPNINRLVADDWLCERRTPVTAIVWWGSYIDYAYEACQSQVMTPPVKPDYFKLNIWTDVPSGSSTVAAGSSNGYVYVYDRVGNLLFRYYTGADVASVDVSVDGRYIAVGSYQNRLYLFDRSGTLLWQKEIPIERSYGGGWMGEESKSVSISADGGYVVAACSNGLYVYNNDGTLHWSHPDKETCVDISPNGNYIAACNYNGVVRFFSIASSTPSWTTGDIDAFWVATSDPGYVAASKKGNTVYLYDNAGTQIWSDNTVKSNYVRVDMPQDGLSVVAVNDDSSDSVGCELNYWNDLKDGTSGWGAADGTPVWTYNPGGARSDFYGVAISGDGGYIATGPAGGSYVFSSAGGAPVQTLSMGTGNSYDLTYDGQYGACGNRQGDLYYFSNSSSTPLWSRSLGGKVHTVAISVNTEPSFSHPNEVIWEYKAYDYDEVMVGYDKDPNGDSNEPVFRYSVRLPEEDWFKQKNVNDIFWLSVVAVYDANQPSPNYDWGWTNHQHRFNDDAVSGVVTGPNEWMWEELYDQTGASEDMSFVLFMDPNGCDSCADYNSDGTVDTNDLKVFVEDWLWTGPSGGYSEGDLNCDGKVMFVDYAIFALQWLDSCP